MGFSRTNLFKRLESGGHGLPPVGRAPRPAQLRLPARARERAAVPIGTAERRADGLADQRRGRRLQVALPAMPEDDEDDATTSRRRRDDPRGIDGRRRCAPSRLPPPRRRGLRGLRDAAASPLPWLRADLFGEAWPTTSTSDAEALIDDPRDGRRVGRRQGREARCAPRAPDRDAPGREGARLHPVRRHRRLPRARAEAAGRRPASAAVTGDSPNPTALAWRFSPVSNGKRDAGLGRRRAARADRHRRPQRGPEPPGLRDRRQLRPALGDHPPRPARRPRRPHRPAGRAILVLLVPAGRGRRADHPPARPRPPAAAGERRGRRHRRGVLRGRRDDQAILDLYHEKAGVLDGEADGEVDLASYAFQIWKNAIEADPSLQKTIPDWRRSRTRPRPFADAEQPGGVLVYLRTARRQRRPRVARRATARASPSRSSRSSRPPSASRRRRR